MIKVIYKDLFSEFSGKRGLLHKVSRTPDAAESFFCMDKIISENVYIPAK